MRYSTGNLAGRNHKESMNNEKESMSPGSGLLS